MESTLPPEIAKKSLGSPNSRNVSGFFGSGCGIIATENPASQRTRPRSAAANEGWSTYASPDTMMMSG
ncbi:MAG: hypothetical protein BWY45_02340 [Euryarchaeota archaeon ADurb.Bin294]|nr:MAG: hypothetical protein BWY45_02340 [Euryarchaeota archaeon ADurb.Bin294]